VCVCVSLSLSVSLSEYAFLALTEFAEAPELRAGTEIVGFKLL